jgi:hypothetical protein
MFCNPGSLGRVENTGTPRIPRVCIIVVDVSTKRVEVQYVPLTHATPHPFKEKVDSADENPMKDVARLLELIGGTQVQAIDLKVQLPAVAQALGFTDVELEAAFALIESVQSST